MSAKLIISGKPPVDWNNLKHRQGKSAEASFMHDGFTSYDLEFEEISLTNFVKSHAMVLANLKKGKRTRTHVKDGFNVIGLDFDNSQEMQEKYGLLTLPALKERLNTLNIAYFIYTTPSHSPECPKLRVLIPTKEIFFNKPKTAIDIHTHDKIKAFFLKHFPECDKSVFQPERLFFGNNTAETYFSNSKSYLDVEALPEPEHTLTSNFLTQDNEEKLEFDSTIQLKFSNGETHRLEDINIQEKLPIYCPFHNDSNPSAFINPDPDKYGRHYIHCSSCGKTWAEKYQHVFNNLTLFRHIDTGDVFRNTPKGYLPFLNSDQRDSVLMKAKLPYEKREFRLSIPEFAIRFLPTHPEGYIGNREFNIFELPKLVNRSLPKTQKSLEELETKTPITYKLLTNVFLDKDELLKFLKWNAYILQTGKKAQTSWIIQTSNQRIGKNAICELLLKPLYGENQYSLIKGKDIGNNFNSQDYGCWLRVYDEARLYNNRGVDEHQKEILKNIITEKSITINIKNVSEFRFDNAMNFIFLTNNRDALIIDTNDERFNIVHNDISRALTDQDWWVDKSTFESQIESELPYFADFLLSIKVDEKKDILQTVRNEARKSIQELTIAQEKEFCDALANGDVDYFDIDTILRTSHYKPDEGTTISMIVASIENFIETNKGLPQKYAKLILSYHFKHKLRTQLYGDLKKYGFYKSTIKNGTMIENYWGIRYWGVR